MSSPHRFAPWKPPRRRAARFLGVEELEDRTLLAGNSVGTATPILYTPGSPAVQSGTLADGATDFYQLAVTEPGQLTASVHATGFTTRLSLLDPNGNSTPLIQSDGVSAADPHDLIVQHLEAGDAGNTYYLEVQGLDGGAGDYTLTTQLDPAPSPFPPPAAAAGPIAVIAADFNGDGVPDLVTADAASGRIAIQLGRGDGTFQPPVTVATVSQPTSLVAADFNGDGRLDLAAATADGLVVLLGNGDGTFQRQPTVTFPAGRPLAVVAGDFNGDGRPDLATADSTDDVRVFLGTGRGTFTPAGRFALPDGGGPSAIVAGDFAGGGRLDLAVAESNLGTVTVLPGTVTVLPGRGDGTFGPAADYPVQLDPVALVAGDFTGAGRDDLAVANKGGQGKDNLGSVSVLLSNPDGTFQPAASQAVDAAPVAIAVGHFTGGPTSPLDLAAAEATYGDTDILQGQGDGTFADVLTQTVGGTPASLAVADFDGSGSSDLAVGNGLSGGVSVFLDTPQPGAATPLFFSPPTAASSVRPTPLLADLTGDGRADSVVVSRAGAVLLRRGLASPPGAFAPPVRVNPIGAPARAVAIVPAGPQTLLAAVDRLDDNVSLYAIDAAGNPHFLRTLLTADGPLTPDLLQGTLPTRILAGNLRGVRDGYADIAVLNAFTGRVTVFLSDGAGGFGQAVTTDLGGSGPFDMTLADLRGDGQRDDIVVVDQTSGDLNVLVNNGNGSFFALERYRAGAGPYGVSGDGTALLSGEGTVGVVAGDFDGDGVPDLVAANADSRSLSLLRGRGDGTFFNAVSIPLDFRPGAIAAGRFDGSGALDLAVLDADSGRVRIFLGDGAGNFHERLSPEPLWAGSAPANLSVADVNGDGTADVQVAGDFGDVLTLLGNGDGTFRPFQAPDPTQPIDLAVADGRHFVLSNRAGDRLAVQDGVGSPSRVFQDRADGILAPGQVQTVDVGGTEYLVVANGGANDVLVYRGTGGGTFDAASVQTFFTGTDPVAVTVADVNGDGTPDVIVADQGSNDVSVLFGRGQGAAWTLVPGPRLAAGGIGPVSTTVADVLGTGLPDILVVNRQSNTVALLPGVGNGFFNDRNPTTFATGAGPVQALVGNFDGSPGLLTVNAGGNDLTLFSNFGPGRAIASGGLDPVAAFAGDFNNSGFTDVVVANNADGVFAALVGGPDGLRLAGSLASAEVPHPTAVALSDLLDGVLSIYTTEEGEESVARLSFAIEFGILTPTPGGGEAEGQRPLVTELLRLSETALDVVATLVTGSGLPGGGTDLAVLPGAEGTAGLIVLTTVLAGGGGGEGVPDEAGGAGIGLLPHEGGAEAGAPKGGPGPLSDFVIGVGEEADRVRDGIRRRWRDAESVPPLSAEAPRDKVFKRWLPGGADGLELLRALEPAALAAAEGLYDAAAETAALGASFLLPRGVPEGQPAPVRPDGPAEPNSGPGQPEGSLPLLDDEPMDALRPESLEVAPLPSAGGDLGGRDASGAGEEPERWLQSLVAAVVVFGAQLSGGQDRRRGLPPPRGPASSRIR